MIDKPKKERRFLKTLGKIGEILLEEVLIKVGSNLIKRIGGKKPLPSILFLFLSISLYAQYPATGNKQRLGYQTTGDGLVYRGRALDTVAIKSSGLNNAYFILDTVNNILYNYIKTKGGWKFSNTDSVVINNTIDTVSLSNRINLKVNISDTASMLTPYLRKADTTAMLLPYFKDADTSLLNLTNRFATKLNISDTSSMLTNYLRSGIAASTYLPLTGGTISGTINRLEGSHDGSPSTFYYNILNYFSKRDNNKGNQTAQITFTDRPGTSTFENNVRTSDIYLMTAKNFSGGQLGQYLDTTLSVVANQDGGRIGISKLNPAYKLDVNGTLGVTGATTLFGALTVNNATVLNEGSGDFDTRIESDGNANMVFVDASTDRVGIGTNTPSKTLEVNGEVKIATVTATPTALLGKDGSNVVGEVALGTGMSVSGGILSVQAAGASATGLVTSFGTQIFGGNKTFNGNVTISGASTLNVGSNGTFGGRVNTPWLERTYTNTTSSSFTVSINTTWLDINTSVLTTLTLPDAATYPGKELHIRQTGTGQVQSASSNVIPFTSPPTGSAGTAIFNPTNNKAVTLVSDGVNWIIMQRSTN
jgi:hypothetical protein